MRVQHKNYALPVSKRFTNAISAFLTKHTITGNNVTINFRDPNYSAENGGFHPVEIRLEKHGVTWQLCYITDFTYVGIGPLSDLRGTLY